MPFIDEEDPQTDQCALRTASVHNRVQPVDVREVCVALGAHYAGGQGLEVLLQGSKALLRGALLPALGVAQCAQL